MTLAKDPDAEFVQLEPQFRGLPREDHDPLESIRDPQCRRESRVARPEREIDPRIVRACVLLGSQSAWRSFVQHYEALVYAVLSRRLGRGPHIDDLAQETFIKACRSLASFEIRGDIGLSAWIATIARNVARDEARRRCVVSIATVDGQEADGQWPPMTDRAVAIRKALSELDTIACEAFLLREYEGMTFSEIANILMVAPNTARKLVIGATDRLRQKLGAP